jgi:hypothetical protein
MLSPKGGGLKNILGFALAPLFRLEEVSQR